MQEGPQPGGEALQGLDAYEQMVDSFAEQEDFLVVVGAYRRPDGSRHRGLGANATRLHPVA